MDGAKPARWPKLLAIASYVVLGWSSGGTSGTKPRINPPEKFFAREPRVVVSFIGLKFTPCWDAICSKVSRCSSSNKFGLALYRFIKERT